MAEHRRGSRPAFLPARTARRDGNRGWPARPAPTAAEARQRAWRRLNRLRERPRLLSSMARDAASLQCRAASTSAHSPPAPSHFARPARAAARPARTAICPAKPDRLADLAAPRERIEQPQPAVFERARSSPLTPRGSSSAGDSLQPRLGRRARRRVELLEPLAPPGEADRAERRFAAWCAPRRPSPGRPRTRPRAPAAVAHGT